MVAIGTILPFTPIAKSLNFVPLPSLYFLFLVLLVGTYLLLVSRLKNLFLKHYSL
jgi:Mg2+-importing ATPase